jgi:hypothetical protein
MVRVDSARSERRIVLADRPILRARRGRARAGRGAGTAGRARLVEPARYGRSPLTSRPARLHAVRTALRGVRCTGRARALHACRRGAHARGRQSLVDAPLRVGLARHR